MGAAERLRRCGASGAAVGIITGLTIEAADVTGPLLALLPEYASAIPSGGLAGKRFIAASQGLAYVLGAICAQCIASSVPIGKTSFVSPPNVWVSDDTYVGVFAGNHVVGGFGFSFGVQVPSYNTAEDALTAAKAALAGVGIGVPGSTTGYLIRIYQNTSNLFYGYGLFGCGFSP